MGPSETTNPEQGDSTGIQLRKDDHIRINLEKPVYGQDVESGFDRFRFIHNALPELSLPEVDPSTDFLGHTLSMPILISSTTGGTPGTHAILRNLAEGAGHVGCAIGVGSQRAALEDPALEQYFRVRDVAPNAFLLANIGAVQLNYGIGVDGCRRAIEMIGADALILHLNPIQEAIQSDGNHDFTNLLRKIGDVCDILDIPVVVKEVGFGISGDVARQLAEQGVDAIDVSGAGGTSWSAVESHRAGTALHRELGELFAGWGVPTVDALRMVRDAAPGTPVIASGGLRNGIDVAKAIVLGADLAGIAGPLLRAATMSPEAVVERLTVIRETLRLVMFGVGAKDLSDLRSASLLPSDGSPIPGRR